MRYLLILKLVCAALAAPAPAKPLLKEKEDSSNLVTNVGVIETGHSSPNIFKRGYVTKSCSDSQQTYINAAMAK